MIIERRNAEFHANAHTRGPRISLRFRHLIPILAMTGALIGVDVGPATASTLDTWSPLASLGTARTLAGAAVLQNGTVLVVGGTSSTTGTGTPVATAEVYNPSSNVWSATATGAPAVSDSVVLTLSNGDVLVAGGISGTGSSGNATAAASIYNPTTNVWAATGNSMPTGVYGAASVTLANGSVMVIGGYTGPTSAPTATTAVSVYTPSTNAWTTGDALPAGTQSAFGSAGVLSNGTVLYAGGFSAPGAVTGAAELFDPTQNTWSGVGSLITARSHAGMAVLADGAVLLAGGERADGTAIANAELYNPTTKVWTATSPLTTARTGATFSTLATGQVIAAGGADSAGNALSSAEIYAPQSATWTVTGTLGTARENASAVQLSGGQYLVFGGNTATGAAISNAESYFSGVPASLASISGADFVTGSAKTLNLSATGFPTPTISEAGTLPQGLAFTVGATGSATISGTADGPVGTFPITITATNGVLSPVSTSVNLTVTQPASPGYLVATTAGRVFAFGQAVLAGHVHVPLRTRRIVSIARSPGTTGYYLVTMAGNVFNEGGAPFYGSLAKTRLASPVRGFATTTDGHGYWLVTTNGSVFAFGDATAYGSVSTNPRVRPIVAIVPTQDSKGYYLVSSRGNVFNKGDAIFYGSMARARLPHPIAAVAISADGRGYDLVSSGGNVWNLGDATFYGSKARVRLSSPVVSFTTTTDGMGYYLLTSSGALYRYGDALDLGLPTAARNLAYASITIPD